MRIAGSYRAIRGLLLAPAHVKRLSFEGAISVIAAELTIRRQGFEEVARRLGTLAPDGVADPEPIGDDQQVEALWVGWSVRRAAHLVLGEDSCLAQAVAASGMLRRRGIPAVTTLGVLPPGTNRRLAAHAWVRAGSWTVTGGDVADRYEPLATFLNDRPATASHPPTHPTNRNRHQTPSRPLRRAQGRRETLHPALPRSRAEQEAVRRRS